MSLNTDSTESLAAVYTAHFHNAATVTTTTTASAIDSLQTICNQQQVKTQRILSTEPSQITAVLTSYARPQNIVTLLRFLHNEYPGMFAEIIIVNNNPRINLTQILQSTNNLWSVSLHRTPGVLAERPERHLHNVVPLKSMLVDEPDGQSTSGLSGNTMHAIPKVRVINAARNWFTLSKYAGCLSGQFHTCFILDDDFFPTHLQSLRAAYEMHPFALHTTADPRTADLNARRTLVDHASGLRSGFSWLGVGTFVSRANVEQFIVQLATVRASEPMLLMADLYFSHWNTHLPHILVDPHVIAGLDQSEAYSCSNCSQHRVENARHQMYALQQLLHFQCTDCESDMRGNISPVETQSLTKAPCINDKCLFLCTVDVRRDHISSLGKQRWENRAHLLSSVKINDDFVTLAKDPKFLMFHNAVDRDPRSVFLLHRGFGHDDYFGLDLLRTRQLYGIWLSVSRVKPNDLMFEVRASTDDEWRRVRDRVITQLDDMHQVYMIQFEHVHSRQVRVRLASTQRHPVHHMRIGHLEPMLSPQIQHTGTGSGSTGSKSDCTFSDLSFPSQSILAPASVRLCSMSSVSSAPQQSSVQSSWTSQALPNANPNPIPHALESAKVLSPLVEALLAHTKLQQSCH
jgi:hypothetical protein